MTEEDLKTLMMAGYIMGYGMTDGQVHRVLLPNGERLEDEAAIEAKFAKELEGFRNAE